MSWGAPVDAAAWFALGSALCLIATPRLREVLFQSSRRVFLSGVCASAFGLSYGYAHYYLGGAPRIIDATTYLLSAKLLAAGHFSFAADGPVSSFTGRFLVSTPDGSLAPLFPPGYPALLALGVLLGQPLLLGPVLAASLAASTYFLGRVLFDKEETARLAALLSVLSATLRYHTADTMSHGLCALLFSLAVGWSSQLRRSSTILAGLSCGWLCATRPVTGAYCVLACLVLLWSSRRASPMRADFGATLGTYAWLFAGCLPGVLLLAAQQRVVTGNWFDSLQYLYYARSDYPPGCFRFGLGTDIGCRFEHATFVESFMPNGYHVFDTFRTTARRLAAHACDAANLELFLYALPAVAWLGRGTPAVRRLSAIVVGQMLAYALFYFDGNYPGGGARMFVDVLPFEHLLLAWALMHWRIPRLGIVLSLLGFAIHSARSHAALRASDGGAPMFDARVLNSASITRGLVFVDTDHGFNLGYSREPDAHHEIQVARYHGDASDWFLYEHTGSPPSYRYLFDLSGKQAPRIVPYVPVRSLTFSASSFWPPPAVEGGAVYPSAAACYSQQGALTLLPAPNRTLQLSLDVWGSPSAHASVVTLSTSALGGPDVVQTTRLESGCFETTFSPKLSAARSIRLQLTTHSRNELSTLQWVDNP